MVQTPKPRTNSKPVAPEYSEGADTVTRVREDVVTTNEARQAVTGHNVSTVLFFSLAAAAVVFVVLITLVY